MNKATSEKHNVAFGQGFLNTLSKDTHVVMNPRPEGSRWEFVSGKDAYPNIKEVAKPGDGPGGIYVDLDGDNTPDIRFTGGTINLLSGKTKAARAAIWTIT